MKAIARQGVVWALLAMLALPAVVYAQVDIGTDPTDPPTIIFGPPSETISSPPTNFQGSDQYTYTDNGDGTCTITSYTGSGGDISIRSTINGLTVTSIGNCAFEDSSVTSVVIPNSVTNIESSPSWVYGPGGPYIPVTAGAFSFCFYLTNVVILSSTLNIGDGAFLGCAHLSSIYFACNAPSIGLHLFDDGGPSSLTVYYLPNTTGWGATFDGFPTIPLGYTFTTNSDNTITITGYTGSNIVVSIPSTIDGLPVTSIGDYAFGDCTNLTSATVPNGVTSIGDGAFMWCFCLTSITIPDSVTSIGVGAFQFCDNLISITIPASVTSIGNGAFNYCPNLTNVYFQGNTPSSLGSYVFNNDPATTIYYLPGATGWASTGDTGLDWDPPGSGIITTRWSPTFGNCPIILWNPQMLNDATFGAQTNCFGFTITNAGNPTVVIEACTDLANPVWVPVATNTLTGGASYFSDSQWTNYPTRYYRLASPW